MSAGDDSKICFYFVPIFGSLFEPYGVVGGGWVVGVNSRQISLSPTDADIALLPTFFLFILFFFSDTFLTSSENSLRFEPPY